MVAYFPFLAPKSTLKVMVNLIEETVLTKWDILSLYTLQEDVDKLKGLFLTSDQKLLFDHLPSIIQKTDSSAISKTATFYFPEEPNQTEVSSSKPVLHAFHTIVDKKQKSPTDLKLLKSVLTCISAMNQDQSNRIAHAEEQIKHEQFHEP